MGLQLYLEISYSMKKNIPARGAYTRLFFYGEFIETPFRKSLDVQ